MAWSSAAIGGVPLDQASPGLDKDTIAKDTKDKAASISDAKGSTAYGVGSVAAALCKTILFDERSVVPFSHYQEDLKVCLSTPAVLGRKGLLRTLPVQLNAKERREFEASAKSMKEIIDEAEKDA